MARLHLLACVTAVSLLLLGCQFANQLLQSGSSTDFGVARDESIVLLGSQPRTLDPATTLGGPDGPLGHIFSGLVTLDADLQLQPELAAGWDVSLDGLVYTFYLRQDAVFHDGRRVTADDIVFSWERATDPATGSDTAGTYLGDIAGVDAKLAGTADTISGLRALDAHTLEVTLAAPVVYFLAKLAYPVAYVVDRDNVAQPGWEYRANGTGPYRLHTWRDDDVIILERHDGYYLPPARTRYLVFNLGPGLALSLYETGDIDLVGVSGPTLEAAQDPNSPLNAQLRTGVDMCTSVIGLNNRLPPFDDARVRQAFNYALDKERLIETFYGGSALVAQGSLPPGMPGYGGLDGESYPYDPQKARDLLAAAGYADPADLGTLTYSTAGYGSVGSYVTAVITLWQEALGVTIQPVAVDPFLFLDRLYDGDIGNFYSSGWCADYPDPQNFLDVLYHSSSQQNLGGFSSADIDALLEKARVERDVAARLALYQEAERQIVAQAPVVFVSHGLSAVLVKPYLEGYKLAPIGVRQWHHVATRVGDAR